MTPQFRWAPSSPPIATIHRHICGAPEQWPCPKLDAFSPSAKALALDHWRARLVATFQSVRQAASIHRWLLDHYLPFDIQSAQTYVISELNRHLALLGHLVVELGAPNQIEVPTASRSTDTPSLSVQLTCLFGFNLPISHPLYQSLAAVSDDEAIAEIATMLADSTEELMALGKLLLAWIHRRTDPPELHLRSSQLSSLMAAFETAIGANPDVLDHLAGQELTLTRRDDNPGILPQNERQMIFYASLSDGVFNLFEHLGFQPLDLFHQRDSSADIETSFPIVIAASGHTPSPNHRIH